MPVALSSSSPRAFPRSEPGRRRIAALLLAAMTGAAAAGASERVSIVTAGEVEPGLVSILDTREVSTFRSGHLPASRRFDWRDWTEERPGFFGWLFGDPARWGRLRGLDGPSGALTRQLSALGLANDRAILVVGGGGGWGEEGRCAWSLLAWGARDVRLLDGGFPAWSAGGERPVERGPARVGASGDFRLEPHPERRIDLAELTRRRSEPGLVLLDARTPAEFAGERLAGQRRGGHLPGARLVPAAALYRSDGRFVGAEELAQLVGDLQADGATVTYCTGGIRSALLAVLLEARLGIEARNFDGSLWEWSAHRNLPLATDDDGR